MTMDVPQSSSEERTTQTSHTVMNVGWDYFCNNKNNSEYLLEDFDDDELGQPWLSFRMQKWWKTVFRQLVTGNQESTYFNFKTSSNF